VYQVFNPQIAKQVVEKQNFYGIPGYSLDRIIWIKATFSWMMYRSGWAKKKDQERILAIFLT
jgi:hypothetical protein